MLMHALEVLCNEPSCYIFCWQFDIQFVYAKHLAHPIVCRPTHLNIYGYTSALNSPNLTWWGYSHVLMS